MDGGREITDLEQGLDESRGSLQTPPTTKKTAPGFLRAVRACLIQCVE